MIASDCVMTRAFPASSTISTGTCDSGFSARKAALCCSSVPGARLMTRRSNGTPFTCMTDADTPGRARAPVVVEDHPSPHHLLIDSTEQVAAGVVEHLDLDPVARPS